MTNGQQETKDWQIVKLGGFMSTIGPMVQAELEDGSRLYGLRIGEEHLNSLKLVHGGVIASLVDQAIALEIWNATERQPLVTVQLDIRYVGGARAGMLLETVIRLRSVRRSIIFADADVMDDAGELIACANAVMKRIKPKETPNAYDQQPCGQ